MVDEIKKIFQNLDDNAFSDDRRLEKALENAKKNDQFRKINYGKYEVLLCGDHNGKEINLQFLRGLKKELASKGITCRIGEDYIKKAKGAREQEIRESYLKDADIIVLINGQGPGTLDESNQIRRDKELKKKTMAFFKYSNYQELENAPDLQDYRTEFKYPIPYQETEELKAKIKFGIKHIILYLLNKEITKSKDGNQ
ncbi:MAG TPA: hypothetical protein VJK05_05465 [archaeon]|nr:hypothetical protein [archaeon]